MNDELVEAFSFDTYARASARAEKQAAIADSLEKRIGEDVALNLDQVKQFVGESADTFHTFLYSGSR
jgi:hypothetical protein